MKINQNKKIPIPEEYNQKHRIHAALKTTIDYTVLNTTLIFSAFLTATELVSYSYLKGDNESFSNRYSFLMFTGCALFTVQYTLLSLKQLLKKTTPRTTPQQTRKEIQNLIKNHRPENNEQFTKGMSLALQYIVPGTSENDIIFFANNEQTPIHHKMWRKVLFNEEALNKMALSAKQAADSLAQGWLEEMQKSHKLQSLKRRGLFAPPSLHDDSKFDPCLLAVMNFLGVKDIEGLHPQKVATAGENPHWLGKLYRDNHKDTHSLVGRLKEWITTEGPEECREEPEYLTKATLVFFTGITLKNTRPVLKAALRYCADNPDLIDRVRQEIEDSIESEEKRPQAYRESKILRKIFIESLRLQSPVKTVNRGNTVIPLFHLAQDPNWVGENPKEFNIDRHENVPKSLIALKWLPLGNGVHACPGWKFTEAIVMQVVGKMICEHNLQKHTLEEGALGFLERMLGLENPSWYSFRKRETA